MIRHKYNNIYWRNRRGINGWGDTLNRLSYYYRMNEHVPTVCNFWDKYDNFEKAIFIRKHIFQRNTNFAILSPFNFERDHTNFSHSHYMMPYHEYWPSKYTHKGLKNKKIAFNLYRNNFPQHLKHLLHHLELENKEYKDDLNELQNELYWAGYEMISLYDLDDYRGCSKIMKDPVSCINANMKILEECEYFIGSEGFMTHVSRSMKVPTLVFFNNIRTSTTYQLIKTFDKSIQHPVYSNQDIFKKILDISP